MVGKFDTFKKALTAVGNFLGNTQVTKSFKEQLADNLFRSDIDMGLTTESDIIRNAINNLNPNKSISEQISRSRDIELLNSATVENADFGSIKNARARQGYAYTPQGDLKAYSAQRVDKTTGKMIQESGSDLMKNLHLYPEFVQRVIMFGINRPQKEIVQGLGRETSLPTELFSGLAARTDILTGSTAPTKRFSDNAFPGVGGAYRFNPNYLAPVRKAPDFSRFEAGSLGSILPPITTNTTNSIYNSPMSDFDESGDIDSPALNSQRSKPLTSVGEG